MVHDRSGAHSTCLPRARAAHVGGGGLYPAGTSIDAPPLTETANANYTFSKWSTQSDGSDTVTLPYTMPGANTTLYAIFTVRHSL